VYFVFSIDCLDNGNNKKALQEADKVLKKQKDFVCAKVNLWLCLKVNIFLETTIILIIYFCKKEPCDDDHPCSPISVLRTCVCLCSVKCGLNADEVTLAPWGSLRTCGPYPGAEGSIHFKSK